MLNTEEPVLAPDQLPDSIGPYRLEERLGSGGMGEVYRGYDARLDRPVALKRVRPGVSNLDVAARRFRREARAAARLRHPAIVQVYDWVEADEGAWLVMEMVDGRPLRDLLHGGPLEPARVACFAKDLLEGLAVAHEAGLVHRDLKASNVMITTGSTAGRGRGEQARILDFGLAKKTHIDEDSSLSVAGKIIGTLSALAPEQVLGKTVDGRTDLFALGCMLYEALTGRHPFLASGEVETLSRICNFHQQPVKKLCPEVSESLSAWVDALLQKDPRRRPPSAAAALASLERASGGGEDLEVLALDGPTEDGWRTHVEDDSAPGQPVTWASRLQALKAVLIPGVLIPGVITLGTLVLGAVAFLGWPKVGGAAVPIYVAVPVTQVTTVDELSSELGGPELGGRAIHTALLQGLIDLQGIIALEVPADAPQETQDLARELAADEVLVSRLDCDEGSCRALLRRVSGDGQVLWAHAFTADPQRLLELSQAVLSHLANAYPDTRRRPGAAESEVRPDDYESFLSLDQRFKSRDQGLSSEQLLDELDQLSETSPRFVAIPLLAAHVALQRFQTSRDPRDAERAADALERARALTPQNPRVLLLAARAARQTGDLEAAEEWLRQARQLEPGHAETDFQLALLHEKRGGVTRAITLAREAISRRPSVPLLLHIADLFSRQGDFAGARELIEQGLKRDPDHFDGLSRLAQLELMHGDMERAANLYGKLVERSPEDTELINLGTALMMLGRLDEAKTCFVRVVEGNPSSSYATLNLADVTKLLGDAEGAAVLYGRLLELIEADADPSGLATMRAQALAHLGRKEAAVEAIQVAIRQRPEHPGVAYEAALVYSLINDRASAVWNARRALAAGMEPRWFSLAWLDPIRGALDAEISARPDKTGGT